MCENKNLNHKFIKDASYSNPVAIDVKFFSRQNYFYSFCLKIEKNKNFCVITRNERLSKKTSMKHFPHRFDNAISSLLSAENCFKSQFRSFTSFS